jgi:hypothetical protein
MENGGPMPAVCFFAHAVFEKTAMQLVVDRDALRWRAEDLRKAA